ncbi:MAG: hypothetical protein HY700_15190 [Gemmatimonadetes bacterium]|nr:hypothetical protein [Gemmatimonadota bacterium]
MATSLDLTPFGFTATENLVYTRLLHGGPASGYAVSRDLLVARANVYQALRGLVAKGAAVAVGRQPQRFRAVKPLDLYAGIVQRETRRLDELEEQLRAVPDEGTESFVPIAGERGFLDVAARAAARERGPVLLIGPHRVVSALLPVLRKRLADGLATDVWLVGESAELPIRLQGTVSLPHVQSLFGAPVTMVIAGEAALVARLETHGLEGYWTTDRTVMGATRAAVLALTSGPEPS